MRSIRGLLFPQEGIFFELLESESKNVLKGAQLLSQMATKFDNNTNLIRKKIKQLELEGDKIVAEIHQRARRAHLHIDGDAHGAVDARNLFGDDHQRNPAGVGAAVFFRHHAAEKSQLTHLAHQVLTEAVRAVVCIHGGSDFLLRKLAGCLLYGL